MRIKSNQILFFGVIAVVALIMYYSFEGEQINTDYVSEVTEFREDKDKRFKFKDDSPLDKKQKAVFEKLHYFPVNPALRVQADLTRLDDNRIITLQTTKAGGSEDYIRWAKATFKLEGKSHELTLLKPYGDAAKTTLHLFFRDATSGNETYGGGRYIDIEPGKTTCMIDFNMAFNPYCVYNSYYICPIPPKENRLDIAIKAGEKVPQLKKVGKK